ncbi:MAG: heparinase II/III family protein [Candidatus Cloacimonetes bacterium]|nr:heparinase II/III family protein [Candidatus Cloacimonadota bacterium]
MKKLLLASLLFLLTGHILLAQGSWMPEKNYWPRTLVDSSQVLVQEVRDRVLRAPYSTWYASICAASDLNYSSYTWEKQKARIARCAAFRFFIEGDSFYGDKAKEYLLVANREESNSISEEYGNIIWDSEIISMICIAYDFLKGNNYDFDGEEQQVRDRIQWVTGALYESVIDDDLGLLHYAWVLGHGEETNYGVKLASAVGMAAIVLNTETSGSNHQKPSTWIEYAVTKLYRQIGNYLIDQDGGWAEGHHYLGFSAVNFIPFAFSYENFTDGIPQTFGSTTYSPPLQQYNFQQNTEWGIKIRMPDGSRPPIDDCFLNSYYYSAAFAPYYENDVLAWDYIHSDQPYNTWASSSNIDVEMICLYDDVYAGTTEPNYTSVFIPRAGQAVFRNDWERDATYMCLVGEYGVARTGGRSHEHPDNMSFIIYALGEYLALDSGYISWGQHNKVMNADNHNLILVNGSGPSSAGTYTANGTDAHIQNFYDTRYLDYAEVQTSYQNVDFTRCATFFDNEIFILTDFITSSSTKTYEWLLHGNGGGSTGGQFTFLTDDADNRSTIGSQYTQNNISLDCYINSINAINFSSYDDFHDDGTYNVPATHTVTKASTTGSNTIFSTILIPHESTKNITYESLDYGTTIGGLVTMDSTKILTLAKEFTYGISTLFDSVPLVFNANYLAISKENGAFQPTNVVLKNGDYLHYDGTTYFINTENRCDLALHIDDVFADGYMSEQGWVELYTGNEPSSVSGAASYDFYDGILTMQFDEASNFYIEVDWSIHPIRIDSLSTILFSADDELTIYGLGFEQTGTVYFNALAADEILSWNEAGITLVVPEGVSSGNLVVENMYGSSNESAYQIMSSTGDPEVAQPIPNHVITAGTTKFIADLNTVFWDPNGDTLLFSLDYDSPYLTHNEDSLQIGIVYFTAQDNQQDTLFITATAQDADSASASDQFIVFIQDYNDPPQIDTIPIQVFSEDDSLTIAFSYFDSLVFDPDNSHNELTYSFEEYAPLSIETHTSSFHIHAPADWFGQIQAVFQVTDGQNISQESCEFSIQSINDPPVISVPDSIVFFEDDTYVLDISAYIFDIDDSLENLVLTWIDPQNIDVLQIGWDVYISTKLPDWYGTDSIKFTITDDELESNSDVMQVQVLAQNDPPYVQDTIPDLTRNEDFADTIQVFLSNYFADPDNDSLIYFVVYDSNQISVSLDSDLLNISSLPNRFGDAEIFVTAHDGNEYLRKYVIGNFIKESTQDSFMVHVLPVNDPPSIALPDSIIFLEDDSYIFDASIFISDVDDSLENLVLTWIDPQNIDVLQIDWDVHLATKQPDWHGSDSVAFTITDDEMASSNDVVQVLVLSQNDLPYVQDSIPDFIKDEDFADTIQVYLNNHFADPDNDSLTYFIAYDSTQISVSLDNNLIHISSVTNWFGDAEIIITADDGIENILREAAQDTFYIHILPVNDPPQILLPDTFSLFEDDTLTVAFDVFVSDVDNELRDLTLSWLQPNFIAITKDDWNVSFTNAIENWNGLESVTFIISDPSLALGSDISIVHIYPQNDPPYILPQIGDFTILEDTLIPIDIWLDLYFHDPDGDVLGYHVEWNSTQLDISIPSNSEMSILPQPDWFGISSVFVTADDGYTFLRNRPTVTDTFDVIVEPVNDPPQIISYVPEELDIFLSGDSTIYFEIDVFDVDNADLDYVWTVNDTVQNANDSIFAYHFDEQGIFSIVVVASDQEYKVSVGWHVVVPYFPVQGNEGLAQKVNAIKPNPYNPDKNKNCEFYFESTNQKKYSVNIYNISGQFIKSINSEFIEQKGEAFVYQAKWDGRNENGLMCTSGLYLFKVNIENTTYIKKMLLLH